MKQGHRIKFIFLLSVMALEGLSIAYADTNSCNALFAHVEDQKNVSQAELDKLGQVARLLYSEAKAPVPLDIEAMEKYQESGTYLNGFMRGIDPGGLYLPEEAQDYINRLEQMFKAAPITGDGTILFRGLQIPEKDLPHSGDVVKIANFLSTSPDLEGALDFSGPLIDRKSTMIPVLYIIDVPKGIPFLAISKWVKAVANEREMLLPKNLSLSISQVWQAIYEKEGKLAIVKSKILYSK